MLKKEIEYVDWDGKPQKRLFHFNLSVAEMTELEMLHDTGSYREHLQAVMERNNKKEIWNEFKELLTLSVGRREGENFIKSDEISRSFMASGAYDEFLLELLTDTQKAVLFFNEIFPKQDELKTRLAKYGKTFEVELPSESQNPTLVEAFSSPGVVPIVKETKTIDVSPLGIKADADTRTFKDYTQEELLSMSSADYVAMVARTKAAEAGKVLGE